MMFHVIEFALKTVFYTTLLYLALILSIKLLVEPKKGVCKCRTKLEGKVVLVTGGNSGIGLETARDMARRGAITIIASRNVKKSEEAVLDIQQTTGNDNVICMELDLADATSIKNFAKDFNERFDRLDILVNNSGTAASKKNKNGHRINTVVQVNYIGTFMLTNLLMNKLISSKPSRIVIVSSALHSYNWFDVDDIFCRNIKSAFHGYNNSKLYNVMWAKALAKRLPSGVTANSLHPGIVNTDIFLKLPSYSRRLVRFSIYMMFKSPMEGAQTSIHLCVSPDLDGVTGEYFTDCKAEDAAKVTEDEVLVDKVWDETMKYVESLE